MVIQYVKILDKEYPVKFNNVATSKGAHLAGISSDAMLSGVDLTVYQVYYMLFAGILEGHRKEGKKCRIADVDELIDMIEQDEKKGGTAGEDLMQMFIDSRPKDEVAESEKKISPETNTNGIASDTSVTTSSGSQNPES